MLMSSPVSNPNVLLRHKQQALDWMAGEQQRIGLARLFFRQPTFGVLDECTNAISVEAEEALYQHAAKLGITLITITQRAALLKYHAAGLLLLLSCMSVQPFWIRCNGCSELSVRGRVFPVLCHWSC